MRTAKNKKDLAKRVNRFLLREKNKDDRLTELLKSLESRLFLYLFGGVVRDIAMYGNIEEPSDIDIVYVEDIAADEIESLLNTGFETERNRFGGFRISTKHWSVDLWSARNTWAIREGHCNYDGIHSLLNTTITNWESILYGINTGSVICNSDYFRNLQSRYVDVVCDKNPNSVGMYVRIARGFALGGAKRFSSRAVRVLRHGLNEYSFSDISSYERTHYRASFIDEATYDYLLTRANSVDSASGIVKMEPIKRTETLFDTI